MSQKPNICLWDQQGTPPHFAHWHGNNRRQKKGRPEGRPHIALDCCAPSVHPYTMETSLQLAHPAPFRYKRTSLSASLLEINIGRCLLTVKLILIFSINIIILIIIINNNRYLSTYRFFNILTLYTIFGRFYHRHQWLAGT